MSEPITAPGNRLTQRREQVLAALPTSEDVVRNLRDLVDMGLPGYSEPGDEPFEIPADIPPALKAQLIEWEERHQLCSQLWADDRFRLGFAIGAGLIGPLLLNPGLGAEDEASP